MGDAPRAPRIDCLQYCNWSEKIFRQMREGGLDAVHVTICYHENFRETVANIEAWNRRFERYPDLIMPGRGAGDVHAARDSGRTAVFFGFQNCSPIEDDIGLVEICHALGARFMQLSYNNQSLLATGCYEADDPGITRMGRGVIEEMNRVGLVVDMSHSAERSTLEAIALSARPIAITHANPHAWHSASARTSVKTSPTRWWSGCAPGAGRRPSTSATARATTRASRRSPSGSGTTAIFRTWRAACAGPASPTTRSTACSAATGCGSSNVPLRRWPARAIPRGVRMVEVEHAGRRYARRAIASR